MNKNICHFLDRNRAYFPKTKQSTETYTIDATLRQKLILKLEILIADWRKLEPLAPIGRAKENLASI